MDIIDFKCSEKLVFLLPEIHVVRSFTVVFLTTRK